MIYQHTVGVSVDNWIIMLVDGKSVYTVHTFNFKTKIIEIILIEEPNKLRKEERDLTSKSYFL